MTRARNAHCSFWGPLKVGQIQCLKKGLEDLCPSLEFLNALRQMMNWYRSSPFFLSRKLKTKYYWVIVVASHVESVKHWSIWNGKASFCFYASAWSVLFTREQYWGSCYLTNLFTLMLRHYGFGCVLHLFVKHEFNPSYSALGKHPFTVPGWVLEEVKRMLCLVFSCLDFITHPPDDLFVQDLAAVYVEGKARRQCLYLQELKWLLCELVLLLAL